MIEAELKSKERDYRNFMKDAGIDLDDERDGYGSPELLSTPVADPSDLSSPYGVKFLDENSLERRRRRREIRSAIGMESVIELNEEDEGSGTKTPNAVDGDLDSNSSTPRYLMRGEGAAAMESIKRSSSVDQISKRLELVNSRNFSHQTSPVSIPHPSHPHPSPSSITTSTPQSMTGLELGQRPKMSPQTSITSSITPSLSEFLAAGSPTNSIPDDLYQLMTLWNGTKAAVHQQRQRLERIQELWKTFEGRKEEFLNFLSKAEQRLGRFFEELGKAKDIGVIQSEITVQKVREGGRDRKSVV